MRLACCEFCNHKLSDCQIVEYTLSCICVHSVAQAGKSQFDQEWGAAEQRWEDRWQAAFASNNSETSGEYSGSLPVLDVASSSPASPLDRRDTAKQKTDGESELHPLERAYYMGVLTLLLVQRNNLSMPMPAPNSSFAHAYPHQPRIYMTGLGNDVGDSVAVGLTQRWFWDSAQHAMASSLLDPVMYRANAEQILTVDLHDDTGIDLHSFVPPAQESTNERYVPPLRSQFYPDGPKPFYGFNPWSYVLHANLATVGFVYLTTCICLFKTS